MADTNEIKFSEDMYATKDEVMEKLNIYNVDFIWNKILDYRKLFAKTLELNDVDKTKFCLTYTKNLILKVTKLERLFTKAILEYSSLINNAKVGYRISKLSQILEILMSNNGVNQSTSFLSNLVTNSLSTIPNDCIIIDNYSKCLKIIEKLEDKPITKEDINSLYLTINNGYFSPLDLKDNIFRTTSKETPHYYSKTYFYSEALANRIEDMVNLNVEYINEYEDFPFIKAIVSLFYFDYINPYELFRNEMTCLFFKMGLAKSGYSSFSVFSSIENLILFKDEGLLKAKQKTQKYKDLTYFVLYVVDFLIQDTNDLIDSINEYKNSFEEVEVKENQVELEKEFPRFNGGDVIQEGLNNAYESINKVNEKVSETKNNNSSFLTNNVYGQVNVALPIFPSGLQDSDILKITNDLMETYPSMKYSQAHFYASHCTIGRFYTINQFKQEEKTSYETARTSMDYLASIGFYQKTQMKNKFVYRPIPRNTNFDND